MSDSFFAPTSAQTRRLERAGGGTVDIPSVAYIGRGPNCHVQVEDLRVSREHVLIEHGKLTNRSAQNPVWVDGIEVPPGGTATLEHKSEIELPGSIKFRYLRDEPPTWQRTGTFSQPREGMHIPEEALSGGGAQAARGWTTLVPAKPGLRPQAEGGAQPATLFRAESAVLAPPPRNPATRAESAVPAWGNFPPLPPKPKQKRPYQTELYARNRAAKEAAAAEEKRAHEALKAQAYARKEEEHKNRPDKELLGTPRSREPCTGRPVFKQTDGGFTMRLPQNMDEREAQRTITSMLETYKDTLLVFEEMWTDRTEHDASAGDLTDAETESILTGLVAGVAKIRVRRLLWRVCRVAQEVVMVDGAAWTIPKVEIKSYGKLNKEPVFITLDTVGVRFSQPYARDLVTIGDVYNHRLDSAASVDQDMSEINWKLMWYQNLRAGSKLCPDRNLNQWTRDMSTSGVHLLTEASPKFMSALSWWGDRAPVDVEDDDEFPPVRIEGDPGPPPREHPHVDHKRMVPTSSMISLAALFRGKSDVKSKTPPTPKPTVEWSDPDIHAVNIYTMRPDAPPVERATLASTLGTAVHSAAALSAILRVPGIPTGITDTAALERFVKQHPATIGYMGDMLDTGETVAAVEFPVYWCALAKGGNFVGSNIDAVTTSGDGYDVWEFKTRWGAEFETPPVQHIRQAALYCYMFVMQTRCKVHNFHLRYVRIVETKIKQTTYTYKFDESMRSFFLQALDHSEDWTADRLPKTPEQPQLPPKKLSIQHPATAAQKEAYFASGWRAPVRSSVARADGTYPPLRPVDTALHAIVDDDGVGDDDEAPGDKRAAVAGLFRADKRRAPAGRAPVLSPEDRLKEARADWDAAKLHATPSTAAAMLSGIAFLSLSLRLYKAALEAAKEAIDKDSSNIAAYAFASTALTYLGRRNEARVMDEIKKDLMEKEEDF